MTGVTSSRGIFAYRVRPLSWRAWFHFEGCTFDVTGFTRAGVIRAASKFRNELAELV